MEVWRSGRDGSAEKIVLEIWHTDTGGNAADITSVCSDVKISESESGRCAEISLSVPDVTNLGITRPLIMAGDKITVKAGGEEIYIFVVTSADRKYPLRTVKGRDFGQYFEKNEIVIQFSGISCREACRKVFETLGVAEAEVCEMSETITGVYIDSAEDVLSEIMKLQQNADGEEYDYRLEGRKAVVYRLTDEAVSLRYKPAENVAEFDAGEHHERMSYSHDIGSMYNSVRAVIKSSGKKGEQGLPSKTYIVTDNESVAKYGKREKILNVSSDKADEIEELAENELKDKSEIKRTVKVVLPGVINARKNDVIEIKDEYIGIDGKMRIKSISHSFKGGIYTMELGLEIMQ